MNQSRWRWWTPVRRDRVLSLVVLLLILIPRLTSLDAFLTADEDDQLAFARHFLGAAQAGDWQGALVLGYPGVPSMALGAAGLWTQTQLALFPWPDWPTPAPSPETLTYHTFLPLVYSGALPTPTDYLATIDARPLRFIWAVRLPLALLASGLLFISYLLLKRLFLPYLALLSILLIAFNPIMLANARIIHVDGPLAHFMLTAWLAFLVYLRDGRWRWLFFSGALGGLAILSKTPGVLLLPILLATGVVDVWLTATKNTPHRREQWQRLGWTMLLWGGVTALAFILFWPSMWNRPLYAVTWIVNNAAGAFSTFHPTSGEFWGRLVTDRSPFYYVMAFPFHLTPLTTIGLVAALFGLTGALRQWRRDKRMNYAVRHLAVSLAALAFVIIFAGAVSLVSRRGIRYILPVFPILDVLAAIWLGWWVVKIRANWAHWALLAIVAVQSLTVISYHPYYFNYFNPLLGGGNRAAQYVLIGWGEGLDQAAAWLNDQPGAFDDTVAAWYSGQFAPYFKGKTVDLSNNEAALQADYTVFYLNQIQRGFPSKELVTYFADRVPKHVTQLNGVDYAWIYPGPIVSTRYPEQIEHPLTVSLGSSLKLLGYDLPPTANRYELPMTLYWQVQEPWPNTVNLALQLKDEAGLIWGQADRLPLGGIVRGSNVNPGDYLRDDYRLRLQPGIRPGAYSLHLQLYNFETGEVLGNADYLLTIFIPEFGPPTDAELATLPNLQVSKMSPGVRLVGHTSPAAEWLPGIPQQMWLYWQTNKPLDTAPLVELWAEPLAGGENVLLARRPLGDEDSISHWLPNRLSAQPFQLNFPVTAPSGDYRLVARIGRNRPALLGQATLQAPTYNFTLPEDIEPVTANFGETGQISLAGYQLIEARETLTVTLYWRAQSLLAEDYKVFVHLLNDTDEIVAQSDSVPGAGRRPTTTWLPGEVIADEHILAHPAQPFTVWVGLYQPETGMRLTIESDKPTSEARLRLYE